MRGPANLACRSKGGMEEKARNKGTMEEKKNHAIDRIKLDYSLIIIKEVAGVEAGDATLHGRLRLSGAELID